jgi:hypothetical protein
VLDPSCCALFMTLLLIRVIWLVEKPFRLAMCTVVFNLEFFCDSDSGNTCILCMRALYAASNHLLEHKLVQWCNNCSVITETKLNCAVTCLLFNYMF